MFKDAVAFVLFLALVVIFVLRLFLGKKTLGEPSADRSGWVLRTCNQCWKPYALTSWLQLPPVSEPEARNYYEMQAWDALVVGLRAANRTHDDLLSMDRGVPNDVAATLQEEARKRLIESCAQQETVYQETIALRRNAPPSDARKCGCGAILEVSASALKNPPPEGAPLPVDA